jgi:dCTP deaminase
MEQGTITIDPFLPELMNPNSYNYRLGANLKKYSLQGLDSVVDARRQPESEDILIPEEGYLLLPGHLYLGHTVERIGATDYVPSLIGRSSMGRMGLWLQVTADLGNLGNVSSWTLELKVVQPLRVYAGMRVGQVTFWSVQGDIGMVYEGKYHGDTTVVATKMEEEMDDTHRF